VPKLSAAVRTSRRQHLINAGWRCLARTGYADLTVDDICREAKTSKGAFYVYFPHKEALLLALLEDDADRLSRRMKELSEVESSAARRLRAFAGQMVESAKLPGRVQIAADVWAAVRSDPRLRRSLGQATAERRRMLRSWVEEGIAARELRPVPANALAALMLALGDGLILHSGLDPEGFKWENIRLTLDALVEALAPK
jgi:TetR/AcrR family transcriptional repressor of uid operon